MRLSYLALNAAERKAAFDLQSLVAESLGNAVSHREVVVDAPQAAADCRDVRPLKQMLDHPAKQTAQAFGIVGVARALHQGQGATRPASMPARTCSIVGWLYAWPSAIRSRACTSGSTGVPAFFDHLDAAPGDAERALNLLTIDVPVAE